MKILHLLTNHFHKEDICEYPCLSDYEITEFRIGSESHAMPDGKTPALIMIQQPEYFEGLWDYIQQIEAQRANAMVLLVLDEENFSYAYEASRFYRVSLLLKKADENEWNCRIEMCLERLRRMERTYKDRAQLEEYEYQKNHKIMERLLANILDKPEEVEFLLPEINKRYGTKLGDGEYQVLVICVDQYELCTNSSRFLKEITLLTSQSLTLAEEIIMGYQQPYGLIGIVHYKKDVDVSEKRRSYEKLLQQIFGLQTRYGNFQVTLSVGDRVDSISKVSTSLETAELAKEYRMLTKEALIYASEITALRQKLENYLPERKRKELIRYIALGDVRHVNSWFLHFHQNVEPGFMKYPPAFALFCRQVYCDMSENEKTAHILAFPEWRFNLLQHIFDGYERNRELETILLEICHMMAEGMKADQDVAVRAIAYMKVHFKEPINLEFIAEKCGLSTSYFSRKFKEQTGENYIDVLTDIRIREAQKLLGTTDLSIMEIIEEVGYCDDKHFRKLFYKVTGLKPMEYRKKIRSEKNFE